jgi:hypothetical protein
MRICNLNMFSSSLSIHFALYCVMDCHRYEYCGRVAMY